jgi:hypothetical protein
MIADGGKDGVCVMAGIALEVAPAEMAFFLHVTDERFDDGSASEPIL